MLRQVIFLLILSAYGLLSESHAAISVGSNSVQAVALTADAYNYQAFPSGTVTAALPGLSSTGTSVYTVAGNSATFVTSYDELLRSGHTGYGNSVIEHLAEFQPSVDVPYEISGTLTFTSSAGYTGFYAQLFDSTTSTIAFENYQFNEGGSSTFSMGKTAGNFSNLLEGSLTGMLLGGHVYQWDAFTHIFDYSASSGTASGSMSLVLGSPLVAVPEPKSIAVWSLLALTLGGGIWLRRASARRSRPLF